MVQRQDRWQGNGFGENDGRTAPHLADAINAAVGGTASSAYLTGYAVDFICPGLRTPLTVCEIISRPDLDFDQLIQDGTWVHLSFDPQKCREVLTRQGVRYQPGLDGDFHALAELTADSRK